jgi:acetoin utilization deacetylase AcuC-like enzyme
LAQLMLETDDFGWVTDQLSAIAAKYCQNRIVSVLEGGYNLTALEESVAVHLERLAAPSP